MSSALNIKEIEAVVYRCPIGTPVQTSFGLMRDRPAVFVRVEDMDGAVGWGEIWCNFPSVAAEHRRNIVASVLAPLLRQQGFGSPAEAFIYLTEKTRVLAIQSAEPGPIAQSIAGIDIALWDLFARRKGIALWSLFDGASPEIGVYASGINPTLPTRLIKKRFDEGHRAFKLKIGFGPETDAKNLAEIRAEFGGDIALAADANQAWDFEAASSIVPVLQRFNLAWLEEPLCADTDWTLWKKLSEKTTVPLAAGENIAGDEQFSRAIESRALGVIQPDLAKWGGFTRCVKISRAIRRAGLRFCPHYLGGGIGLVASAHLLAAVGGDGILEIDSNENPLRENLIGALGPIVNGRCRLGTAPGLGFEPDLSSIEKFRVT